MGARNTVSREKGGSLDGPSASSYDRGPAGVGAAGVFQEREGDSLENRQEKVLGVLDRHGASLHKLLARLTLCEHATGDLMQELFICLAGSRGFDKANHPYAFAWRTAANLAFEWRRRRGRLSDREEARLPEKSPATPLEELIHAERLERVLQATSKLNELGRNVVVMRFIEQEPYDEIARRLGKNPDYVRVVCSKSVRKLRGILDRQDPAHADAEVSYD